MSQNFSNPNLIPPTHISIQTSRMSLMQSMAEVPYTCVHFAEFLESKSHPSHSFKYPDFEKVSNAEYGRSPLYMCPFLRIRRHTHTYVSQNSSTYTHLRFSEFVDTHTPTFLGIRRHTHTYISQNSLTHTHMYFSELVVGDDYCALSHTTCTPTHLHQYTHTHTHTFLRIRRKRRATLRRVALAE